jgi:hypothetical protein
MTLCNSCSVDGMTLLARCLENGKCFSLSLKSQGQKILRLKLHRMRWHFGQGYSEGTEVGDNGGRVERSLNAKRQVGGHSDPVQAGPSGAPHSRPPTVPLRPARGRHGSGARPARPALRPFPLLPGLGPRRARRAGAAGLRAVPRRCRR